MAATSWQSSPDLISSLEEGRPKVLDYWLAVSKTTTSSPKGLGSAITFITCEIWKERNKQKYNWYVVFYGGVPVIYTCWDDVSPQVTGYAGNRHKGSKKGEEAEEGYSQFLPEESSYYEPLKIAGHAIPKIA
ncbi:hypothetical protein QYE76_050921 [Lolium multiflorum]|uniref:Ribonuclease H1 N-terminal domain-containing protein n=1 Tax=Lolium multiflorum TaxID=4521 RepID=A0AAD8SSG8_LOLMU|nr:hypothetical protein QYE76_050921 [Lolium multiflorum]